MLLEAEIGPPKAESVRPPEHHVVAPSATTQPSRFRTWTSSGNAPTRPPPNGATNKTISFRNPWPSWHKPTRAELWNNLQWGEQSPDPCIDLATSHLVGVPPPTKPPDDPNKRPSYCDITGASWPDSVGARAARLLRIEKPDFEPPKSPCKAKVTWLGHAGVLVQLPSPADRPINCLFDPIFSSRCSPYRQFGPIRTYPPPCTIKFLPPLDAVFISHNHYDHLDQPTIASIWTHHGDTVRFFVPLNNGQWLLKSDGARIPPDRVHELDWWDTARLASPSRNTNAGDSSTDVTSGSLRIWCTPNQHNSGRAGSEVNAALWSSWTLEYQSGGPQSTPYRVFFAGDTGYQFHDDPDWPPKPPVSRDGRPSEEGDQAQSSEEVQQDDKFPTCPAFAEIRDRIGPPHLLLLPISVGATYSYLRSFFYVPDWMCPLPRASPGFTAANHMPSWDAVRVLRLMTGEQQPAVAVAMHWGTFVPDPAEVLQTLGQLEWACRSQGVKFARTIPEGGTVGDKAWFLALNHGHSVCI